MRKSVISAAVLLLCLSDFASGQSDGAHSLAGKWLIQPPSPPGVVVLQAVTFTESKNGISGEFETIGSSKDPKIASIKEIEIDGEDVSFKVFDPQFNIGTLWKGRFGSARQLQMVLFFYNEKNELMPSDIRVFRRSSAAEFAKLKAGLPANIIYDKVPLPPLRDLPSNGLAPTPPMGWNSWNRFLETIDARTVREIADELVSSGLRDAGYRLLEIDDGWQGRRDAKGVLHANSKFPDMKALIDYVHLKGLQFGIYTSPGPVSCGGYVGSHGYETQDAQLFARWGVDFVKNDVCSATLIYKTKDEMRALHQKMAEALRATGRPIMYNVHDMINVFPDAKESWGRKVGANFWRTGGDLVIGDRWTSVSERFDRHGNPEDAGPGGWNDADIMVIGLDGVTPADKPLTVEESRTHMTLWSILASPLVLGNDIRVMTPEVRDILMNGEVIAVNQDPSGKQGRRVVKNGTREIWAKPLADGSNAVAMFNRGDTEATVAAKWVDLGLAGPQQVRDLWKRSDLGRLDAGYDVAIPAHGSVLLKVQRAPK